jgi:hypothetical protein
MLYTASEEEDKGIIILEDERLPPGGFSLRHGFPSWFRRTRTVSGVTGDSPNPAEDTADGQPPLTAMADHGRNDMQLPQSTASTSFSRDMAHPVHGISVYELLSYVRSTFDDQCVLDDVPLAAAANTGAWRAWNASSNRRRGPHTSSRSVGGRQPSNRNPSAVEMQQDTAQQLGEWNWDGVWEMRAKRGIEASTADVALFATSAATNDLV